MKKIHVDLIIYTDFKSKLFWCWKQAVFSPEEND